jgi:hypothetical protein
MALIANLHTALIVLASPALRAFLAGFAANFNNVAGCSRG